MILERDGCLMIRPVEVRVYLICRYVKGRDMGEMWVLR